MFIVLFMLTNYMIMITIVRENALLDIIFDVLRFE